MYVAIAYWLSRNNFRSEKKELGQLAGGVTQSLEVADFMGYLLVLGTSTLCPWVQKNRPFIPNRGPEFFFILPLLTHSISFFSHDNDDDYNCAVVQKATSNGSEHKTRGPHVTPSPRTRSPNRFTNVAFLSIFQGEYHAGATRVS
jgi:hypothetical protein